MKYCLWTPKVQKIKTLRAVLRKSNAIETKPK